MQKRIKHLLQRNFFIIAISITIAIGYLSLMKMPKSDIGFFPNSDKIYHLFAYFSLAISWLFSFLKKQNSKFIIALGCIIYGIIIEVLQNTLTTYRTGDYLDVLANTLGVVLGLVVFNLIFKKISVN